MTQSTITGSAPGIPGVDEEAGNDLRESLANDGRVGPIRAVQLALAEIVAVRGIGYDLDRKSYRVSPLTPVVPSDPVEFYEQVARDWLARDPVLAKAEVRMTGTGLHAILRPGPPIELRDAAHRDELAAIVQLVQAALPVDPGQPGITMTTRAVGSANPKNGRTVGVLATGEPVTEAEIQDLAGRMRRSPFRTVLTILAGAEREKPCPICGKGSLVGLDRAGKCYGCRSVGLADLYDIVYATAARGGDDA